MSVRFSPLVIADKQSDILNVGIYITLTLLYNRPVTVFSFVDGPEFALLVGCLLAQRFATFLDALLSVC